MKKLLLLIAVCIAVSTTQAFAQKQETVDPGTMMTEMKDKLKPQLVQQAKITDAQAERVFLINYRIMQRKREVRMDPSLNEEQKKKEMAELDAERDKEFSGGVNLTEEQIKAVNAFFADLKKPAKKLETSGS